MPSIKLLWFIGVISDNSSKKRETSNIQQESL